MLTRCIDISQILVRAFSIKGIVHPKKSFNHFQVVPNLYKFWLHFILLQCNYTFKYWINYMYLLYG